MPQKRSRFRNQPDEAEPLAELAETASFPPDIQLRADCDADWAGPFCLRMSP